MDWNFANSHLWAKHELKYFMQVQWWLLYSTMTKPKIHNELLIKDVRFRRIFPLLSPNSIGFLIIILIAMTPSLVESHHIVESHLKEYRNRPNNGGQHHKTSEFKGTNTWTCRSFSIHLRESDTRIKTLITTTRPIRLIMPCCSVDRSVFKEAVLIFPTKRLYLS